jgi:TetR/AcrR family fatty acid metabolism transcriptional regulator
MGVLLAGLAVALEGADDPSERIRRFARYHFRQVRDHRALAEVLQIELRLSNKFLKEYRPTQLWEYLNVFAGILREGQERGVIREVDPFASMWAFFGALDEIAMQWVLANKERKLRFSLDASAEAVAEIFVRGVAANPSAIPVTTPLPSRFESLS